jgi:subtilase family protein
MKIKAALAVAFAVGLSACASGSRSGPASPTTTQVTTTVPVVTTPPPQIADPNSFRTAAYLRTGVLDAVHAADAYALGYTGQGVTIGIVDFNFVFSSNQVNFAPGSVGPNPQMQALYTAQTGSAPTSDQHGQAVAVTAAGNGNGGIQGLAFNSTVLAVDYFSGVNSSTAVQGGVTYHVSDPWTYITSRGGRIINTSYGYEASDVLAAANAPRVSQAYVLASAATAVQNGALLVSAAGNGGGTNPQQYDLDTISDLNAAGVLNSGPGAYIIAGAVDQNNQIAWFSDRAGSEAAYYMVAPGVDLTLPWNGSLAIVSGTSFSTPLISGAAAIIMERWPNLTARQVAEILFDSATPLGDPSIYGHGLLNVYAALEPIGVTTMAVANGTAPTVTGTGLVLGSVFGDAPALHRALAQIMILDSFGRDFEINLSQAPIARPTLPDMFGVMENRLGWHSAGLNVGETTSFSFDVKRNPEDGIVPFQALAGLENQSAHQSAFRLSGSQSGFSWIAGTGMSLHEGLAEDFDAFAAASLTNPFLPAVGAAPGSFAALAVPLDDNLKLSLGMSHADNQGLGDLQLSMRNTADTALIRLERDTASWQFSLDAGSTLETGGLFGSVASGGLKMADQAATAWTTATAKTELDANWSFKGAITLAASGITHPEASLITSIGPVYATSFALGLSGHDLFRGGDGLFFSVDQPLRAESAMATLATGIGRDWSTGDVIMGQARASLVPSGREVDFETGYGFSLGNWRAACNAAFAYDANHMRGKNALLTLFTLSRAL